MVSKRIVNSLAAGAATAFLCTASVSVPAVQAAEPDPSNLSEGYPVKVEDARAAAPGERQLQLLLRYDRTATSNDRYLFEPGLQFGFGGGWQATVNSTLFFGPSERTNSGNVRLELLRQFQPEAGGGLGLALSARADLPSGQNSEGVDTRLKLLASKAMGGGAEAPRLHLNVAWKHNDKVRTGEIEDGVLAILGFSRPNGDRNVIVLDYIYDQDLENRLNQNVVEIGLVRRASSYTLVSAGAGLGLDKESPDFRLSFGVQQQF